MVTPRSGTCASVARSPQKPHTAKSCGSGGHRASGREGAGPDARFELYAVSSEGSFLERMEPMARPSKYSPKSASGPCGWSASRPEHPSQWAAIASMASKLGCTAETLRQWVRQAERDSGQRGGLTTDERQRLKELERENRELKRANEILRKASAYFAQAELDRRAK